MLNRIYLILIIGLMVISLTSANLIFRLGDEDTDIQYVINTTISNQTNHWDNLDTPADIDHNDLFGIDGGSTGEYYHFNLTIYNYIISNIYNWLTSFTESDPLWESNYSAYNDSWSSTYNSTYDNHIEDNVTWNESYADTKYLQSYTETDSLWTSNYTAHNDSWTSTYNSTYDAWNDTGYIKDWNSTGLIANWSTSAGNLSWNESYADTLYEPLGGGDNSTWNESYADTLYAPIGSAGNPFDQWLNTTDNVTHNIVTITEEINTSTSQRIVFNHSSGDIELWL